MKALFTSIFTFGLSCVVLTEVTLAFDSSLPDSGDDDINAIEYQDGGSSASENSNDGDSIVVDDDENHGNIHRSYPSEEGPSSSRKSMSFTPPSSTDDGADGSGVGGDADGGNSHPRHGSTGHSAYYYSNNDVYLRTNASYDDEQTYLDLFGERAKELLTQHVIPTTDAECRWDWRTGRCEPYCKCAYQFLWGDFHLGRSCRYRLHPPPSQSDIDEVDDISNDEPSWQEAWQEVWNAQITEGSSAFAPPLVPKSHREATETSAGDDATSTTCTHPPLSVYIRVIRRITKYVARSNAVLDRFHKLKSVSVNSVDAGMVHSRNHLTNMRHKACETVKKKVEERAKGRNQPVVLTRQGAIWIRRVCGSGDDNDAKMQQDLPSDILEVSKDWQ
ncbi:hypothetical protein ACHAXA_000163 [Cyclostephanos tholiformis]|uniref:Uncharacterized protein n=1 Tax=Cyclostephanos tholiformis TaxID=382380 RepID=A0ABD3SC47_9STRA